MRLICFWPICCPRRRRSSRVRAVCPASMERPKCRNRGEMRFRFRQPPIRSRRRCARWLLIRRSACSGPGLSARRDTGGHGTCARGDGCDESGGGRGAWFVHAMTPDRCGRTRPDDAYLSQDRGGQALRGFLTSWRSWLGLGVARLLPFQDNATVGMQSTDPSRGSPRARSSASALGHRVASQFVAEETLAAEKAETGYFWVSGFS